MAACWGTSKFGPCYSFDAFLSNSYDYREDEPSKACLAAFRTGSMGQLGVRYMRNMLNIWKLAAGAGLAFALQIGATAAGERGCFGDCYEQVPAPVIHRTFLRRVEIERGAYEIDREPSLYGLATRRVLLDDGIDWQERPAVYKTVKVRKHVKSRVIWEKRWVDGKHIMCKVRVPGKTVWATKRILVSGARRSKAYSNPTYGYVQKRILLRPYKNIAVYHRARHKYVREHVAIQPEASIWQPISGGPAYRY